MAVMVTESISRYVRRVVPKDEQRRTDVLFACLPAHSRSIFADTVFICILISTIALAIENNFIGKGSTLHSMLYYSDIVINIMFSVELILKVNVISSLAIIPICVSM